MAEKDGIIHTSQKHIAQMIADMKLLVYLSNGKYKPLLVSTITTYISTILNEDKKKKSTAKPTRKKTKK